jgi:TRAP-type C4-dicarboxylate transport system permease small subunit
LAYARRGTFDRNGSPNMIRNLLVWLRTCQLWFAAIALIVMMCVTICDVFLRYVFNSPIRGSYEIVESTLVISVFHGMSSAFLYRRNIVIDLIDSFAGSRFVAVLIRIADLLAVIALCLLTYAMIMPAMQAYAYGDVKQELQLPIYWLWIVALAGMVGTILCAIGRIFLNLVDPDSERHA